MIDTGIRAKESQGAAETGTAAALGGHVEVGHLAHDFGHDGLHDGLDGLQPCPISLTRLLSRTGQARRARRGFPLVRQPCHPALRNPFRRCS